MASTFTGLKLQGQIGKFGAKELSDIEGQCCFADRKRSGWHCGVYVVHCESQKTVKIRNIYGMSLCTMCWTLLLISRLTTPLVLQLTHLLIKKLKKDWCLMLLICSTLEHAIGGRYLKKTKREWGTDFCRNKDPRKLSMSIPFSTSPSTPIITGIVVAFIPHIRSISISRCLYLDSFSVTLT